MPPKYEYNNTIRTVRNYDDPNSPENKAFWGKYVEEQKNENLIIEERMSKKGGCKGGGKK